MAIALLSLTANAFAREINQNAKASVSNSVKDKLDKKNKIIAFIKLVQPKYSKKYIDTIANSIMKYSIKYRLDPFVITTTAYVESEFNMKSRNCIGIMQIYEPSINELDPKKEYNPYTIDGNIGLGAKELSKYLKPDDSRGDFMDRSSNNQSPLKIMWGRYNGSGPNSSYVTKTFNVLRKLYFYDLKHIEQSLKKSPLW